MMASSTQGPACKQKLVLVTLKIRTLEAEILLQSYLIDKLDLQSLGWRDRLSTRLALLVVGILNQLWLQKAEYFPKTTRPKIVSMRRCKDAGAPKLTT